MKTKLFCTLFLLLLFLCSCGKSSLPDEVIIGRMGMARGNDLLPSIFHIDTPITRYYIIPSPAFKKDAMRQINPEQTYVAVGRRLSDIREVGKYIKEAGGHAIYSSGQYFLLKELHEYSAYDISKLSGKHKLIGATFRVAREMKGDYAKKILDDIITFNKTEFGNSSLHLAVYEDESMVRQILAEGIALNDMNNNGETPLFCAVKNNDMEIVKILLKNGADVNMADPSRMVDPSILNQAIYNKNLEMVKLLLSHGVEVNPKWDSPTPLYYAVASAPHYQIAELLLKYGADVDKGCGGISPLMGVIDKGNYSGTEMVEILFVKLLLKYGADIDKQEVPGWKDTPLHIAVHREKPEILRLLLQSGADKNIKNADRFTPAELAKEEKYFEGEDILREADSGGKVNL